MLPGLLTESNIKLAKSLWRPEALGPRKKCFEFLRFLACACRYDSANWKEPNKQTQWRGVWSQPIGLACFSYSIPLFRQMPKKGVQSWRRLEQQSSFWIARPIVSSLYRCSSSRRSHRYRVLATATPYFGSSVRISKLCWLKADNFASFLIFHNLNVSAFQLSLSRSRSRASRN